MDFTKAINIFKGKLLASATFPIGVKRVDVVFRNLENVSSGEIDLLEESILNIKW